MRLFGKVTDAQFVKSSQGLYPPSEFLNSITPSGIVTSAYVKLL